ncbi:hypothetical protein JW823_02150 [bacterium]|nr:hypothetical protein [candidate division CSSED10-310 bacterium]
MHVLFLTMALVFNAMANILMKVASSKGALPGNATITEKLFGIYLSWPFAGGLVLFGLNLLCYTFALSRMNLSVAYPIMVGVGFTIIGIASCFFFQERLSLIQMMGLLLILVGVTLVAQTSSGS